MKKHLITLTLLLFVASMLMAETVEEKLQKFGQDSAEGFIQPFVNAFGNNLNSGFFNTAKVLKPFRFQLNVNMTASLVPDADKTFMVNNPFINDAFNPYNEATIESSTIFGKDGGVFTPRSELSGFVDELAMPGGLNLEMMPFAVPQFSMGLPLGNEVLVRYFPKMEINKDIGEFTFYGIGLKHSISQYIPFFPLDVAVQGVYQKMEVGELITIDALAYNAEVSKSFMIFTLYGGIGFEDTNFKAEYSFEKEVFDPNNPAETTTELIPVKLELASDNSMKATVGLRMTLLPFIKVYGDYNMANYESVNAGLAIGF
ncbi:MAG TPA: hypothetical protein PKZ69_04170 [Candidatus Cloacimonadota bacterium]|nr:hypothetical protein [Candidatus Cloacimonadota bacterium]HPK40797.1 hypothetical protein [Candidatus Cloacimonadota bacterium]